MTNQEKVSILEDALLIYKDIPEENWCEGEFFNNEGNTSKCCAIGHYSRVKECKGDYSKYYVKFDNWANLTDNFWNSTMIPVAHQISVSITHANDNTSIFKRFFPKISSLNTPKQRVIAYLELLINKYKDE